MWLLCILPFALPSGAVSRGITDHDLATHDAQPPLERRVLVRSLKKESPFQQTNTRHLVRRETSVVKPYSHSEEESAKKTSWIGQSQLPDNEHDTTSVQGKHAPRMNWIDAFDVISKAMPRRDLVNSSEASPSLAFTGCGENYCKQTISAIKTAVAQMILDNAHGEHTPWQVYLVADKSCQDMFGKIQDKIFNNATHDICSVNVISSDKIVGDITMFRQCSAVRLYLPRLLKQSVDRVLYIDADAMVTRSLKEITSTMKEHPQQALFMAEEVSSGCCQQCGWYGAQKYMVMDASKPNGFNAGILGININTWMAKDLDSRVSSIVDQIHNGSQQVPLGDQDVLNLMIKVDASLLFQMPQEFNLRKASCERTYDDRKPLLLHGNEKQFQEAGSLFQDIGGKLLSAADRILEQGVQPNDPSDLWDKAGLTPANLKSLYKDLCPTPCVPGKKNL